MCVQQHVRPFAECLLLSATIALSLFIKITFWLIYNLEMIIKCVFNPGYIAKHNQLCFCNLKSLAPLNRCSFFHFSCTVPPDIVYYLSQRFSSVRQTALQTDILDVDYVCVPDLSARVDAVKEENLKLKSENQVLGQYIENLMSASSVFQTTDTKSKRK
ncbi:short coiled-coil protein A [Poecilia reticulata]|uniref:short coiled-coil protein A n=1 Tax=Poecilia reticulata TaxID=8081 RepID=UPI0007EBA65B|nr:PREDICTED: short coiled-coil protein [Poecilia reticulata]